MLISIGFFRYTRSLRGLLFFIQRRGIEITARELSALLMRLIQAGLLKRRESASGQVEYYQR